MVQKTARKRGRPRAYDPETALAAAMGAFWDAGYAGTSLDDISVGTGMNRPSLYAAFGDKHALYLQALERYRAAGLAAMQEALAYDKPLRDALRTLYERALALYLSGGNAPRGCFLIGTALAESVLDADVRHALRHALRDFDAAFAARLRHAHEHGDLPRDADPAALGTLASAVLHTLAIRSRAGEPRKALEATIDAALDLICGKPRRRR